MGPSALCLHRELKVFLLQDVNMKTTVSVAVALFAYGGNGGTSSLIPELAVWFAHAYHRLKTDPRVERVGREVYSDTPIYMTRNRAVRDAIADGYDFLLMLDSDNEPDAYYGHDPSAKLFLNEPFDFAFERLKQGLPTVIAAPYCGPPPPPVSRPGVIDMGEVPYLFQMTNKETIEGGRSFPTMLTRMEAARLKGIVPMWALPTGVCLFSLNSFNGPPKPYFRYEHDEDWTEKRGTEDCYATRNLNLYWLSKIGQHVCYAACDSWAFHHKPKRVGKPDFVSMEEYAKEMRDAILEGRSSLEEQRHVDFSANIPSANLPRRGQVLGPDDDYVVLSEQDMEQARILVERQRRTGTDIADFATPPSEQYMAIPPLEEVSAIAEEDVWEPTDIDEPEVPSYDGPQNGNGTYEPTLTHKIVAGKKVAVFNGFEVPDESLDSVEAMTQFLISRQGKGPLEVAVLGSGTGQCTAILNSTLPEGSHIYALDCIIPHKCSPIPAEQFKTTFQEEISRGRIQPNNDSRKMPYPVNKLHLDMVFIEQFITEDKLQAWLRNVQPGGLMAGLGYSTDASRRTVNRFAKKNNLLVKDSGDVWAIPLPSVDIDKAVKEIMGDRMPDDEDERVDLESLNELT